jgi:hypothetical protein
MMRSTSVFEVFVAVFTLAGIVEISPSHARSSPTAQNSRQEVRSATSQENGLFKQLAQNWPSNRNEQRFSPALPPLSPVTPEPEKPIAEPIPTPTIPETDISVCPTPTMETIEEEKNSVKNIAVTGNTIFTEEINKLKQPLEEKLAIPTPRRSETILLTPSPNFIWMQVSSPLAPVPSQNLYPLES